MANVQLAYVNKKFILCVWNRNCVSLSPSLPNFRFQCAVVEPTLKLYSELNVTKQLPEPKPGQSANPVHASIVEILRASSESCALESFLWLLRVGTSSTVYPQTSEDQRWSRSVCISYHMNVEKFKAGGVFVTWIHMVR